MVEEILLGNGLTVWLSEDHSEPKVYGTVVVKAGAKDSPNTGIAHYFEHIMFKGTDRIGTTNFQEEAPLLQEIADKYSELKAAKSDEERSEIQKSINQLNIAAAQYAIPNDFNNLISRYGGSKLNAGTSYDYTIYHNEFTPAHLEHWLELNSERLLRPVFRLFQSELETVYEEKNMIEDRLGNGAQQALFRKLMAPHPYQYPIIGGTEHLKQPDLHAMESFFRQYYTAGNMGLILTGDFRREGLEELLERTFGRIPSGTPERAQAPQPQPLRRREKLRVKVPIPFVRMSGLFWHTPPLGHPDFLPLNLIAEILNNDSKTGWLDQLVLERRLTSANAFAMALNDVGIFGIVVLPKMPFQTNTSALRLAEKNIARLHNGDFSTEELDRLLLNFRKNRILESEEPEGRHKALTQLFAAGSSWEEYNEELEKLAHLSKEDISAIARKYLSANLLEVRKASGDYPKEKIAKPPFEPLQTPNAGAKSDFAEHLATLPLQPQKIRPLDFERDAERTTLGTGNLARLFRVQNQKNDVFSLHLLYFRSNYHHPELKQLAYYLDLIGGGGRSEHQHNQALQMLGAHVTYQSLPHFFRISVTGFDHLFTETLTLLGQFLFNPELKQSPMKLIAEEKRISEKAARSDSPTLAKRLSEWGMYGEKAPYKQELTLGDVRKLKPAQMAEALQQLLTSELDAHYIGQRPMDEVATILSDTLRVNHITHPWEGYTYIESKAPQVPEILLIDDPKATQATVQIYRNLGVLSPEERKSSFLYNVYLGGGMGSLLFQEVRELRSLGYSVSSQLIEPTHNQLSQETRQLIRLGTQSDKTAEALRLLLDLLSRTPNEPQRYLRTIEQLKSDAISLQPKLRMRSRTIAAYERQGLTTDYAEHLLRISQEVTPEHLVQFHQEKVAGLPVKIMILGNKKLLPLADLQTIAPIKELPNSLLLP